MTKTPTFENSESLVRFIPASFRTKWGNPATAAFIEGPAPDSIAQKRRHLSVNSLEVETRKSIVSYYMRKFSPYGNEVNFTVHKIHQYREAGLRAGVVFYGGNAASLEFECPLNGRANAFRHRPVDRGSSGLSSLSHCGVEFVRALTDTHSETRFARRMAKQKVEVVKVK